MTVSSRRLAGLCAAGCLLLAACGGPGGGPAGSAPADPPAPRFPMTVENCGQQVTIPEEPKRILAIGHEAVEQIYAAGGADRIVARAGGVNAPDPAGAAVADAPMITPEDPSTEVIIGTGVDLVVSYGLFDVSVEDLNKSGITSLVVSGLCGQHGGGTGDGADFEDVYGDVELYGRLFGTEDEAAAAVEQLRQRVAAAGTRAAQGQAVTAAHGYFYGDNLSASGNQSMAQSQMEILGLANVFADIDADFFEGNLEELIDRDPEVLILTYGSNRKETFEQAKQKFLALPGAADMQAVRNDRIVPLPYLQSQASTSAVTGVENIAKGLGL